MGRSPSPFPGFQWSRLWSVLALPSKGIRGYRLDAATMERPETHFTLEGFTGPWAPFTPGITGFLGATSKRCLCPLHLQTLSWGSEMLPDGYKATGVWGRCGGRILDSVSARPEQPVFPLQNSNHPSLFLKRFLRFPRDLTL